MPPFVIPPLFRAIEPYDRMFNLVFRRIAAAASAVILAGLLLTAVQQIRVSLPSSKPRFTRNAAAAGFQLGIPSAPWSTTMSPATCERLSALPSTVSNPSGAYRPAPEQPRS
jgi:hypothetical protein